MAFNWNKYDTIPEAEQAAPASIPVPQEEVGQIEAGLRGGAQGLSLGTSEEILAGGQALGDIMHGRTDLDWDQFKAAYEKHVANQRARESAAAEQNPITYHGAEFGVPLLLPIAGAVGAAGKLGKMGGAIAESAQVLNAPGKIVEGVGAGLGVLGKSPVARVAKGAIEGATLGGLYGAGKTEAPITSEKGLEQIKESATFGGVLGGGLSSVAAGAEGLANKFPDLKVSQLYLKGLSGQNLNDFDKITKNTFDYAQVTGDKVLQGQAKRIGDSFNAFQQAGEASGKKAHIADIFKTLEEMKMSKEHASDPAAQKTIGQLIKQFEDKAYGLEQLVEKQQLNIKRTKVPGQEAVPSTQEALDAQVLKLNTDAVATAKQTGSPIKQYQVVTDPESGGMNIKEITAPGPEKGESANIVNKAWQTPTEGSPAIEPSESISLEPETFFTKERPGSTPELGMNDVVEMEKNIGAQSAAAKTSVSMGNREEIGPAKILSSVDKMITDKTNAIEAGYEVPREQWKQLLNALDKAGINKNKSIDLDIGAAGLNEKLNSIAPEVMQNINGDILRSRESGYEAEVAKTNLDRFFNYLQKSGMEDVPQIRKTLEENMMDYNLSREMGNASVSPGIASHNPKVQALGFLKSYGLKGVHNLGLAQGSGIAQQVTGVLPGILGKSASIQTSEDISRNLSNSTMEQLVPIANILKADKHLSHLGNALEVAINNKDNYRKDSIIFAISQNPEARKLLQTGNE